MKAKGTSGGPNPPPISVRAIRKNLPALARPLFFIPALFLVVFFVVYPVLQTAYLSFLSPSGEFVGWDNYSDVLASRETLNLEGFPKWPPLGAMVHNFLWIAIHLPLSMFAGLYLAIILRDMKGSSIVKSIIFLGMLTPLIVGGLILRFTFTEGVGVVPSFLGLLGVDSLNITWTNHPETVLFALIFGSVWLWTGFSLIVYSAGLTTIPKEYFEAARIDGASPFRMFYRVTFPLLRPMTLVVVVMTIVWELKIFDIVYTGAGPGGGPGGSADVLALLMYRFAFRSFDFNSAAVVATLLTLLTLVVTVWMIRYVVKR